MEGEHRMAIWMISSWSGSTRSGLAQQILYVTMRSTFLPELLVDLSTSNLSFRWDTVAEVGLEMLTQDNDRFLRLA